MRIEALASSEGDWDGPLGAGAGGDAPAIG